MAKQVAKFQKVSYEQFKKDMIDALWFDKSTDENRILESYNFVTLPTRATVGSAGYDFVSPVKFTLQPGQTVKIPTGIRVKLLSDWVMKIYPRSGLGFKYKLKLDNTVGIIDSDYFYSDNEGHIMIKITNHASDGKILKIETGDRFSQGIFVEYGITVDDDVKTIRNGGFGSTN